MNPLRSVADALKGVETPSMAAHTGTAFATINREVARVAPT
jgi:hypothetical protein